MATKFATKFLKGAGVVVLVIAVLLCIAAVNVNPPASSGVSLAMVTNVIGSNAPVVMSPYGGNNGESTYTNFTPRFKGQLGMSWYNSDVMFFWVGGETNLGAWTNQWAFPGGIQQVGSAASMSPAAQYTTWQLNGSPVGWGRSGDSALFILNWSTNALNSGAGVGPAVMGIDPATGRAVVIDLVGCAFNHVPTNRAAGLIPGNAMLVFNQNASMKGLAVASPGISGFDSGNYSLAYFDIANKRFRIPKWVASKYQPSDSGWLDSLVVDPATGHQTNYGNVTIVNGEGGVIYGYDSNFGISFRRDPDFGINNYNTHWAYGGHYFHAGGLKASQPLRLTIEEPVVTVHTNILISTGNGAALLTNNPATTNFNIRPNTSPAGSGLTIGPEALVSSASGFKTSLSNGLAAVSVTVSASPYNFTNTHRANVFAYIGGGAVQGIGLNGLALFPAATNQNTTVAMQPGDWIAITNSTAPTLRWRLL